MFPATPSQTRQAPDFNALMKTAISVIEGKPLATEPVAQIYLEPGINHKAVHRSKPKTNYTLPSDMPKYPLGFVPTNQTPSANGEELAQIRVPVSKPADLLDVFAKITKDQQLADAKFQEPAFVDEGTRVAQEMRTAMKEAKTERKINGMVRAGYTEEEARRAMLALREEEAMRMARLPASALTIEEAMNEAFGKAYSTPPGDEPTLP